MDKYDQLGIVGEGSYGVVLKCRHRESGRLVAIKRFLEGEEDDPHVRKVAMREIRMLKRLRHENLVNLLEVFRRKRRLCLVFEFVENTVLHLLEAREVGGLEEASVRSYMLQVLRALLFCHGQGVIHRDIKPENVLVSGSGVVKLCDFGFARPLAGPGESCTDYVATRWYRAPELLVGDTTYGKEVDVWAAGCLFAEMVTGEPLFPGDSDVDQLHHILQITAHVARAGYRAAAHGLRLRGAGRPLFANKFPNWPPHQLQLLQACLEMDPCQRPDCAVLVQHEYFTHDQFADRHMDEITRRIQQEFSTTTHRRKLGNISLFKKKIDSKLSNGKENEEKPARRPDARQTVGSAAGPAPIPPIGQPAAVPVTSYSWVKDGLAGWSILGLGRSKQQPPSRSKTPAAGRAAGNSGPGLSGRGRDVTARGPAPSQLRPTVLELIRQQRRQAEDPGVTLPNVRGAAGISALEIPFIFRGAPPGHSEHEQIRMTERISAAWHPPLPVTDQSATLVTHAVTRCCGMP
ncbi:cyclin-dependent kinase-like 4 [Pollicipes pollicipes]|uniref:cyclin-dependent kinase-like 4 n=1 Tax=Pollicipes pollicipes TaxID=41117 RepID=UPI00188510F6|nr:cyclin-dependent kinase-like 4 [Pollicipes pollicipes]